MDSNQRIFHLASVLLDYPRPEYLRLDDLFDEVSELDNPEIARLFNRFLSYAGKHSMQALAEHYVQTFDFNEKTTMYLTYLKNGDSPERGQKISQLKELYAEAGLALSTNELPDYLPLYLEFVASVPVDIAKNTLREYAEVINFLQAELAKANSPYAGVVEASLLAANRYLS